MMGWLTTSTSAEAARETRSAMTPVMGARLSTLKRKKLTYVFDIRFIVEIPPAQTDLREGLRKTLLGEVDEIDARSFNPVLDNLIDYVNKRPGDYPGAEEVLRMAFKYPKK